MGIAFRYSFSICLKSEADHAGQEEPAALGRLLPAVRAGRVAAGRARLASISQSKTAGPTLSVAANHRHSAAEPGARPAAAALQLVSMATTSGPVAFRAFSGNIPTSPGENPTAREADSARSQLSVDFPPMLTKWQVSIHRAAQSSIVVPSRLQRRDQLNRTLPGIGEGHWLQRRQQMRQSAFPVTLENGLRCIKLATERMSGGSPFAASFVGNACRTAIQRSCQCSLWGGETSILPNLADLINQPIGLSDARGIVHETDGVIHRFEQLLGTRPCAHFALDDGWK